MVNASFKGKEKLHAFLSEKEHLSTANKLNEFFTRFEVGGSNAPAPLWTDNTVTEDSLVIREDVVQCVFESTRARKCPRPDNTSGRDLKHCTAHLSGVFSSVFQRSLDTQELPLPWKTSTVVPIPKISHPFSANDYRSNSLTSLVVRALEEIIKAHIIN
ncbi:hypothetical protein AAFF_G00242050 [Aldrovandia affinis]|uniref:Reverse transcriptase n=1 Tax=Aldrovandia affinis TaxID=143900 RepID=A0AAD7WUX0_9TELE|nr:hypothetical protein AAFF_G00242050 [Aldrovandia affinis]